MKIAAIILAGGSSTRMTGQKQFLQYEGLTFIERLYKTLANVDLSDVVCVTGYLDQELKNLLSDTDVQFLHNPNHKEGMLSTLQVGLQHVIDTSQVDAILVCLTDQPLIPQAHYQTLLNTVLDTDKNIVCTSYQDTTSPPLVFKAKYFDEILALPGSASAKSIIKKNIDDVTKVYCKEAARDIDTDQDYEHLISEHE